MAVLNNIRNTSGCDRGLVNVVAPRYSDSQWSCLEIALDARREGKAVLVTYDPSVVSFPQILLQRLRSLQIPVAAEHKFGEIYIKNRPIGHKSVIIGYHFHVKSTQSLQTAVGLGSFLASSGDLCVAIEQTYPSPISVVSDSVLLLHYNKNGTNPFLSSAFSFPSCSVSTLTKPLESAMTSRNQPTHICNFSVDPGFAEYWCSHEGCTKSIRKW